MGAGEQLLFQLFLLTQVNFIHNFWFFVALLALT